MRYAMETFLSIQDIAPFFKISNISLILWELNRSNLIFSIEEDSLAVRSPKKRLVNLFICLLASRIGR